MKVGIDNGVSGAVAVLNDHGLLIAWTPMPTQRARKGNEIDVVTLAAWLDANTGDKMRAAEYAVEEPGGSKSAAACASMAASFHAIRALLALRGVRWHRVTPREWQRVMLPGCPAGETKPRALELARRLWPSEQWHATPRCTTPHDGAIDAAIIAEWLRTRTTERGQE